MLCLPPPRHPPAAARRPTCHDWLGYLLKEAAAGHTEDGAPLIVAGRGKRLAMEELLLYYRPETRYISVSDVETIRYYHP